MRFIAANSYSRSVLILRNYDLQLYSSRELSTRISFIVANSLRRAASAAGAFFYGLPPKQLTLLSLQSSSFCCSC